MPSLDEILNEWDNDSNMDYSECGEEARKIPRLHAKYLRWLTAEKLALDSFDLALNKITLEKKKYYNDGVKSLPEYEEKKAKWKTAEHPGKIIIKTMREDYLDADDDIHEARVARNQCNQRINALDMILKSVMNRGYLITNMITWQQYTGGGK